MIELPQNQRETSAHGGGLGSLFADSSEPAGLVTVIVGPYAERLPVGNSTVSEIRNRFRQRFDIDPRSLAMIDGHEVGDDTVVRTGQVLMFVHKSGEKGGRIGPVAGRGARHVRERTAADPQPQRVRGVGRTGSCPRSACVVASHGVDVVKPLAPSHTLRLQPSGSPHFQRTPLWKGL